MKNPISFTGLLKAQKVVMCTPINIKVLKVL